MNRTRSILFALSALLSNACVPAAAPTGDAGADSSVGASDAWVPDAGAQSAADSAVPADGPRLSSDVFLPVSRCTSTPMLPFGTWLRNIPVATAGTLRGCDDSSDGHLFPIDPGNATEIHVQMTVRGFIPVVGVRTEIATACESECDDDARPLRAVSTYETTLHLSTTGPQLFVVGARETPEAGATFDVKVEL